MLVQFLFTDPVYFLRFVIIIVVSITLHELGHGAAAIYEGDNTPNETGHMTWNPVVHMGWPSLITLCIVGMAWGKMPVRPGRFKDGSAGRMLVSAAGPMTNFALAALCIAVVNTFSSSAALVSIDFFYMAAFINIGLGLFNLLPIPPLDGFTVFSEIFPSFKPVANHQGASVLLILLFITGGLRFIWAGADIILKALT